MDKITVVDTYVKADVNRGTFYKYYRDVPDLYDKTLLSKKYMHCWKTQTEQIKCPNASSQDSELLLEYVLGGCFHVVSYWLKNGMQILFKFLHHTIYC